MFSYHSLWSNKFTDYGVRALRAAAEERKSNPDFVKLDLHIWCCHSTYHRSALNITEQCSEPDAPTEVRSQVMWHCVSHTYCWWRLPQLLGVKRRRMEAVEISVGPSYLWVYAHTHAHTHTHTHTHTHRSLFHSSKLVRDPASWKRESQVARGRIWLRELAEIVMVCVCVHSYGVCSCVYCIVYIPAAVSI